MFTMEKQQFKAESQRLLDLMINSIYTHREIFLREIISNASDAIDKLAYTALTDDKVGISRDQFAITITRDMPIPLSETVRVRLASSRVMVMANWSRLIPTLSSVSAV